MNLNSNKPIDLEAHIIYDEKKKKKRIKRKFLKKSKKVNSDVSDEDMYPVKVLSKEEITADEDSDIDIDDDEDVSVIQPEDSTCASNIHLEGKQENLEMKFVEIELNLDFYSFF